jgi:hypothetical protein
VRQWDELTLKGASSELRGKAIKELLGAIASRPEKRDSLALWHVLDDAEFGESAEKELVDLCGEPQGFEPTKDGRWETEIWKAWLRRVAW